MLGQHYTIRQQPLAEAEVEAATPPYLLPEMAPTTGGIITTDAYYLATIPLS